MNRTGLPDADDSESPAPRTVVICDDQSELRAAIRQALDRRARYAVVAEAADGDSAVDAVRSHQPDILILDVNMPGGGPEVARAVRRLHPSIHVLVYSGSQDCATRQRMLDAGANEYLVKAGRLGPLLAALERAPTSKPGPTGPAPG